MIRAVFLVISCFALANALPESKVIKLFDGKTFTGWEGNMTSFRIQDGAIVGGTLKAPIPRNEFLCTTREFSDFVLKLQFKLLGEGANAGVQFRSRRISNHNEVIGYQADLGDGWWGALYDESRRNRPLMKPDEESVKKTVKRNQWNRYEIRAEGRSIRTWINGKRMVDYTEPDERMEQTGIIGLQIHGGPPSEAWYRDITLQPLP